MPLGLEHVIWILPLIVPPMVVIGVLSLVIAARQRRIGRLERRWSWLGPGTAHQGAGRAWTGEVEGRRVEVRWFEDNTTVAVDAHPAAEVAFTREGQPASLARIEQEPEPIPLEGKVAYSSDPADARALVAAPGVDEALGTLLGGKDHSLRAVRVDPHGTVSWFARYLPERALTAEQARRWVEALVVVARASEGR